MKTRCLDSSYDMRFGHGLANYYIDNDQCIGQNIKSRLLLILGEWFLDVNEGTPWQYILGVKPANVMALERWIRKRVSETEGVVEITMFVHNFNSTTRKASVAVTVRTIYSTLLTVTV